MTKVPENSDANRPPDKIVAGDLECGHCGRTDFGSPQQLAQHTAQCEAAANEGE